MNYVDDLLSFMRYEADHYPFSGYKLFEDSPKVKNGSIMSARHIYSTLLNVYSHYFFSNIHIMENIYYMKNNKRNLVYSMGKNIFPNSNLKIVKIVLNVKSNEALKIKMKYEIEKISENFLIFLNSKLFKKNKRNLEIEEEVKYLINYISNMNIELTNKISDSIFEHINYFISGEKNHNYHNSFGRDLFKRYYLRKITNVPLYSLSSFL